MPWRLFKIAYGYHKNDKAFTFAAIPRIHVKPITDTILKQITATLLLCRWWVICWVSCKRVQINISRRRKFPRALALRQSDSDSLWRRVNAPNVNFETIYGGKFTLSTQLIILNYPAILSHWRSSTVFLETSSFYKMVRLSIPPEISL